MIIDKNHPALTDGNQFWEDQLKNTQILLAEVQTALLKLTTGEIQEYTLDTGQSRQIVKRNDLQALINFQNALLSQIESLEYRTGYRSAMVKVIPTW